MPETTQSHDDRSALDEIRAERDAARQEPADLRAWLTLKLRLAHRAPGPEGLRVLTVASDREIIAKIEQLMSSTDT
jgi:hypothetical protein